MRACVLLVVAFAGSACFAEAPSPTDDVCPIGSKGCPCTGGGACDPPLECHAQSQACYDPECDEGSLNCPCFEGMCFGDLSCAEGLCQAPMQTSGSGSGDGSTTANTGGMSSSGAAETGVAETGVAEDTAMDTGDLPDELGCLDCFETNLGSACPSQYDACVGSGCMGMRDCVLAQTSTFAGCCTMEIEDGQTTWNALAMCLDSLICADACFGVETTCPG